MNLSTSAPKTPRTTVAELLFVFTGLVVVCLFYRADLTALNPAKWATVSAWALLLVGLVMAQQLRYRFDRLLRRLNARNALSISDADFAVMKQSLESRANVASVAGSITFPVILLIAYALVWANGSSATGSSFATLAMTLEIVMEFIGAGIVGSYVGRGVYYGFLGTELSTRQCKVNMILGHSDQACGLRPIGDFYFLQALIVALPVAFFAFWAVMMPVWTATWPETRSDFTTHWQGVYVVFLMVAILLEFASFVFPLLSFHRQMKQQKQMLLPLADKLSAKLSQLQWKRTLMMTRDNNSEINNSDMEAEFDESSECGDPGQWIDQIGILESLPTWPIAPNIRNRFAAGNMVFLIPAAFRLIQYLMNAASAGLPLSPK